MGHCMGLKRTTRPFTIANSTLSSSLLNLISDIKFMLKANVD